MPLTLTCGCGQAMQVNEEHAGRRVRCPACQTILNVPIPAAEVEEATYAFADKEEAPPRPKPAAAKPSSRSRGQRAHQIDYHVIGDDMQLVEIELDPGETVVAEAGMMTFMEEGIEFETCMGDGSEPNQGFFGKLMGAGKRVLTGESLFMTHFTNHGNQKSKVAFGAPYPGKILPLDMAQLGGTLLCQKDSFLCAAKGHKLGIAFTKKFGAGLFGREGFILQKIEGDGLAFVHACGAIIKRELHNETLRVDTGCIVAFTPDVDYDIQRAGNLKSMFFGGEGLFLATLSGSGTVWLQSLPFSRLADRISSSSGIGRGKEEGSVLGGLGNLLGGD